jgi:hypothetical protein
MFFFASLRVSSRPERAAEEPALSVVEWDPRILPAQSRCLLGKRSIPTGIPKYGGFSTPQDKKTVLLRSK